MAYIEVHQALRDHRKTIELAATLDMPEPHVVGHLVYLWQWALDNAPDGVLTVSHAVVERVAGWTGARGALVAALISSGFCDDNNGSLSIHDWDTYGGKLTRKREADAARNRANRAALRPGDDHATPEAQQSDVRATSALRPRDIHATSQVEKNREEKNREEKQIPPLPPSDDHATPEEDTADAVPLDEPAGVVQVIRSLSEVTDEKPYHLVAAMCEELHDDLSKHTADWRKRQFAVAERVLVQGFAAARVRAYVRDLLTWRDGPIDMFVVEKGIESWEANSNAPRSKSRDGPKGARISVVPPGTATVSGKAARILAEREAAQQEQQA